MLPGEFWYRMQDADATPHGYARLRVDKADSDGLRIEWDLHVVFDGGGAYEEERSMALDAKDRLVHASYSGNGTRIWARREGEKLMGTAKAADGKESALAVEAPDDAVTGMGFLLATGLPLERGATMTRSDFNEAAGFQPEGKVTLRVEQRETLDHPKGKIKAWKILLERQDGRTLPLWVDDRHVLVQADWGEGNLMVLSEEPTRDLFPAAH